MRITPAPGLTILDPVTRLRLPDTGADVAESSHWIRALACGDVVLSPVSVVTVDFPISDSPNTKKLEPS